jgi:hypothetical protein
MRRLRLIISRPARTRKSKLFCHDTALPCVANVSADEVGKLNQQLSKPGIFLNQRVNVVGVVTPRCRFVPSKGIFRK